MSAVRAASAEAQTVEELATRAIQVLSELEHYDWTGIYWMKGDVLELGPYVGPPTEHARIAVGEGVCGTAVAEQANQIVADVREVSNYLACSVETRAEIVVLIEDALGRIHGQIDVDSDRPGAFDATDEAMLTEVCRILCDACLREKGFSG